MSYGSLLSSFVRERERHADVVGRVLLAAAQVGALAWFLPRTPGFPLDDAWIHQVVARTFATTGTLGYAPGQHGAAATSYLWAALLAVNLKVLHLAPETWSLLLAGGATIASGQLLYGLFVRGRPAGIDELPWRLASLGATAAAMLGGHALWFAHSGMEASALVALSLAAITFALRDGDRPAVLAGAFAGLLALLRPEASALGGLLVLAEVVRQRKISPRSIRLGAPWLGGLAIYVGSNLAKTGHAMPATLSGRRWLWFEGSSGLSHVDLVSEQAITWLDRLRDYAVGHERLNLLWIGLALAAFAIVRLVRSGGAPMRLLFGWAAFHTLFYVVMLPTPGHGGRYQPFVPLLFAACAVLGGALLLWDVVARGRALVAVVAALPWLASAYYGAVDIRGRNDLAVGHIEATELAMGRRVEALPEGAIVASFDIGGVGWATKKRVLDLGGLSDPAVAAQIERGQAARWLADQKVEYVVLPEPYDDDLPDLVEFGWRLHLRDNDALRLEAVTDLVSRIDLWLPGAEATWNSAPRQVLYRVTYTGKAGPRDAPTVPKGALRPVSDPGGLALAADRVRAERELAVLEAWGMPVDVVLTPEKPPGGATGCRVALGFFGVEVGEGCGLGPASSLVVELVRRYVDIADFGGAVRVLPHAMARAKRYADRGFYPSLAPAGPPMNERPGDVVRRSAESGLPLALLVLAVAFGVGWIRTRRAATVVASALALVACRREPELPEAAGWHVRALDRAGRELERKGPFGRTALLVAADHGDAEVVGKLLALGANASAKDDSGATALHLAARRGASECIALLAKAIDRHEVDATAGPRRRTALVDATHAAVDPRAVRALLDAGASPLLPGLDGETAMHGLAVAEPSRAVEIAKLLVRPLDTFLADGRGFTPLHAAAAVGNVALARELLVVREDAGEAKTPTGDTPYDVALRYHQDRVAQVLYEGGSKPREGAWPPLHDAARMNDLLRLTTLVAAGADITSKWQGKTALDLAREHGSKEAAALLTVAKGAP